MSSFDVISSALQARGCSPRPRGETGLTAKCPAHDDGSPSLSVRYDVARGRTSLHCFAGCDSDDVLSALGFDDWRVRLDDGASGQAPPRRDPRIDPRLPKWAQEMLAGQYALMDGAA